MRKPCSRIACLPGAYEEGHIPSGLSQAAAKVATDRASADYQDSHRRIMWDSCFRLQSGGDERVILMPRLHTKSMTLQMFHPFDQLAVKLLDVSPDDEDGAHDLPTSCVCGATRS